MAVSTGTEFSQPIRAITVTGPSYNARELEAQLRARRAALALPAWPTSGDSWFKHTNLDGTFHPGWTPAPGR